MDASFVNGNPDVLDVYNKWQSFGHMMTAVQVNPTNKSVGNIYLGAFNSVDDRELYLQILKNTIANVPDMSDQAKLEAVFWLVIFWMCFISSIVMAFGTILSLIGQKLPGLVPFAWLQRNSDDQTVVIATVTIALTVITKHLFSTWQYYSQLNNHWNNVKDTQLHLNTCDTIRAILNTLDDARAIEFSNTLQQLSVAIAHPDSSPASDEPQNTTE